MKGGQRHDVYWHAPAETTACSLGAGEALGEQNLLEYYNAHAMPKPGWMREATHLYNLWVNIWNRPYFEGLALITDPRVWCPGDDVWNILWRIDPARYAPVTLQGRAAYEPWRPWLNPVGLRLWGKSFGSQAKQQAIFQGKAPWAGHLEMGCFGGASRLALKDGFQSLVEHRQGATSDITSTFVHVMEPHSDNQKPALRSVDVHAATGEGAMGTAIRMVTAEGNDVLVATSLSGGTTEDSAISTDARLAMAIPDMATFTLFDGTVLEAGELAVTAAPTARMSLVRVIGDITGEPQESALIVHTTRPLPEGDVLAGQTVTVEHQTSAAHVSAYEIKRVSRLEKELFRIDLRYSPPFIRRKLTVTSTGTFVGKRGGHLTVQSGSIPPAIRGRAGPVETGETALVTQHIVPIAEPGDTYLGITHMLHDGVARPNGIGRRLWFPRSGFRSTIKSQQVGGYAGWWSVGLVPTDAPQEGSVQIGDPLIIYTIAPGDTVIIPTFVTGSPLSVEQETVSCRVYSTTPGTLRLEGRSYPLTTGNQTVHLTLNKEKTTMIHRALTTAAAATTLALSAIAEPLPVPAIAAHFSFNNDPAKYAANSATGGVNAWIKDHEGTTYVDGVKGKAIHLDGKALISVWKSKLTLKSNSAVSFWIRLDGDVGSEKHAYAPGVFSSNANGAFDAFVTFAKSKGGQQLVIESGSGHPCKFDIPPVTPGMWTHVAISIDAQGQITCYTNGQKAGVQQSPDGAGFSLPIAVIGRGYGGATEQGALTGSLDEVIFHNNVLTADAVATLAAR